MLDHRARFFAVRRAARRAADRAKASRRLDARGGTARRRRRRADGNANGNGSLLVARPSASARSARSAAAETRDLFYPVTSVADGSALDWSRSYTTFLFNAQRATRGALAYERILFGPPSARPLAQLRRQHAERRRYDDTKAPSSHYSASSQSAAKRAKAALLPCVSALPLPPPPPRERGWRLSAESEAEVYRADPGADPADELVVNVLYRNTGPGVRSTSAHFATPVLEYPSKKKAPKPKSRKRGRPGAAGREHDAADRGAAKRSRAHRGVEELPWRRRDSGAPLPTEERFAAAQPKRRIERLRALMRLAKRHSAPGSSATRTRARSVDIKSRGKGGGASPRGRKAKAPGVHQRVQSMLKTQHASHAAAKR